MASSRGSGPRRPTLRASHGSVRPWSRRVPTVTTRAASTSTSRSGTDGGNDRAAASVTTPRMPAHPTTIAPESDGESARPRVRANVARTASRRTTTTVPRVATHVATMTGQPRSDSEAAAQTDRACNPMSRNTEFSSRNWIVRHVMRPATLSPGPCSTWLRCPRTSPATTTASTPEPPNSSVGT